MRRRTGNVQDRGTSFRIRYLDADGIRQHESYPSRDEAERALANRMAEIANGIAVSSKPNTVTFGELANDVLTDYEINGFSSYDDAEARYRLHLLPHFERKRACQITSAQLSQYIAIRQREGAKPGTINRELELARHTFRLAMEGRKLLNAPKIKKLREDNTRTGFFTRDEVERLCRHLSDPLRSLVKFGFLTGWRVNEIRNLEWRHIDFQAGEIRLEAGSTKNREGRVFPMTGELRALLEANRAKQRAALRAPKVRARRMPAPIALHVFAVNGKPVGEFRKTWKTACYKAGLPCTVDPVKIRGHQQYNADGTPKVRVLQSLRTFHDLRRSAAKNLIAHGIPERVVMSMCGWKTRSVFDRYQIVSEADLQTAREKLDNPKVAAKRATKG